jgi:N-acyl homoserine lactone hydrolase
VSAWSVAIVEVGVLPGLPLSLYLPDAPADAAIDIPCYAYVLRAEHGRLAVVDTGFDPARCAAAGRVTDGDPARALRAALARHDAEPADVDVVVHTHLHYDHAQNDDLFPNAEIVVSRRELEHALSGAADPFYDGVGELVAGAGGRLRAIAADEAPAEGIVALPNGGHTPGHQSLLVDTADGPLCLCGDIISLRANLSGDVGPICPDADAVRTFAARVRAEGWEAVPGHEPDLRTHRLYVAPAAGAAR